MTWKQLKKEFDKGTQDAYVLALYKELRKQLKKESQVQEIETKVKEGRQINPEQQAKLDAKHEYVAKMEEIGSYYGMYKKNRGESTEEPKKEEVTKGEAKNLSTSDSDVLKIVAQLIVISNAKGPELNSHFSRKEQDVLHYIISDKRYQLAGPRADAILSNLTNLVKGSKDEFKQGFTFEELHKHLTEKFAD